MSNHKVRFITDFISNKNKLINYYNNYVAKAPEFIK